jgi:solute carrier family 25 phosphate transporter 23/24/25/41
MAKPATRAPQEQEAAGGVGKRVIDHLEDEASHHPVVLPPSVRSPCTLHDASLSEAGVGTQFGMCEADVQFYRDLFLQFDENSDGRITQAEVVRAFRKMGFSLSFRKAKKFFEAADGDHDSQIDFPEFLRYVSEHQRQLKLVFEQLDVNSDGRIDELEVQAGLANLGVIISTAEAKDLLTKVKASGEPGCYTINWNEWRNFHLFHPSTDLAEIIQYWRHGSNLDVGDDLRIPDELNEEDKKGLRWVNTLIAGGAAGAVSRTSTAPLDRLKVLLQVHANSKNNLGFVTGMKQLFQEGGFRGLWRGNGINVIKIAPESAIKFMAYEKMKILVKGDNAEITPLQRFMAGSTAGVISQTSIYPMELLKTKLALRKTGEYTGVVDCMSKVYREGGLKVFYRGYIPNCLGIIPYAGIDLMVYETLKNKYLDANPTAANPGVLVLLACGATSSSCGQLASYPLALIRTKMQATTSTGKRQPSMGALAIHIWKTEGPLGLYRGIIPNFLKVIPAVSISYTVYENVKRYLM